MGAFLRRSVWITVHFLFLNPNYTSRDPQHDGVTISKP